ncbi:MAG: deoxyribose-phosphate aldolase [Coriobacteriia bacterium]|nr:deoxyribose-phosphate aldolase [Coriobacteriia bacterium]
MDAATLASYMDQTLLKPTVGFAEAAEWIEANRDRGFASLCVSPFLTPLAAQRLFDSTTKVCSVAAFPLGYAATEAKADEAAHLVTLGAVEVDMVINIAALLEGESAFVHHDIEAVVNAVAHASHGKAIVKVILETGYLQTADIERGCHLAVQAGAHFVKTSTGFGPRGASVDDVRTMRAAVGPDIGVKAAGGIRDLACALAMIEAGATRLGTSAGEKIVAEAAQSAAPGA